jgi:hypothetical protein
LSFGRFACAVGREPDFSSNHFFSKTHRWPTAVGFLFPALARINPTEPMTACESTRPPLYAVPPAAATPPQDVIAILAHFYCAAGLTPVAAWRSAPADYECLFPNLVSIDS